MTHVWAEAVLEASKEDEFFGKGYRLITSARRAAGQYKRHGYQVTVQPCRKCSCGLPNRYH